MVSITVVIRTTYSCTPLLVATLTFTTPSCTLGDGILRVQCGFQDNLRESHRAIYDECEYTCIEISPQLAALQQQRVTDQHGHGEHFTVQQKDAADLESWGAPSQEHTFLVMAEVLDNMPHDRCASARWPAYQGITIA